jgi:hypothetical protein
MTDGPAGGASVISFLFAAEQARLNGPGIALVGSSDGNQHARAGLAAAFADELYSNFNNIRVRGFILNGAPLFGALSVLIESEPINLTSSRLSA